MKHLAPVFFLRLLVACWSSKSVSPASAVTDEIAGLINGGIWSGTYFDTVIYFPSTSTHRAISDSTLAVSKSVDSAMSMAGLSDLVKYKETDSVLQVIRYENNFLKAAIRVTFRYYYAADSITYDMYKYYPIENPMEQKIHLSFHW